MAMKGWCSTIVVAFLSAASLGAAENPLVDAVRSGNRQAIRALLKKPTDVNAAAADGSTALHWAVRADDLETVNLLLRAGADVNIASRYGVTPLGLAAENGNATLVERLLKAGADPRMATSAEGQTVLMTAALAGNAAIVELLLASGADANARESWLGQTALMWAAAGNHASVVEALLDAGADPYVSSNVYADHDLRPVEGATVPPQFVSRGGLSALHLAARQGAREVVRVMADKGVDLERADPDGTTALIFATFNGHFDTAALLLERGADPNRSDTFGQTVLFLSADLRVVEDEGATIGPRGAPPKTLDTNETSPFQLVKLAIAKGANPNPRIEKRLRRRGMYFGVAVDPVPEGATPLWRAARTFDIESIEVLLAAGADPTIPAIDGRTSLMAAAGPEMSIYSGDKFAAIGTEEQRVNTLRLLLDAGVDVRQGNRRGETPLHVAAATGQPSVVKLLVERGARLDTRDSDNRTPLDVALGIDRRPRGQLYSPVPVDERVVALLRDAMIAKGIPIEPWVAPAQSQGPSGQ